jgi:hypothetical protein
MQVLVNELPRTRQNVVALRELIASNVTDEEKEVAMRLLARQYTRGDPTGMNDAIAQDLKSQIRAPNPRLARAATLAYSRLGWFPDYQEVLFAAKNRGTIDDDTYFGELAHMLMFAPATDQERLAGLLLASKNTYASPIVASMMANATLAARSPAKAQLSLAGFLEQTEPQFGPALGQFGFDIADRYSTWLQALATLRAPGGQPNAELIMTRLDDANIDPRKVMAFLGLQYGPSFMSQVGRRSRFEPMLQRISLYARQHPQTTDMQEIVDTVRTRLSALPG